MNNKTFNPNIMGDTAGHHESEPKVIETEGVELPTNPNQVANDNDVKNADVIDMSDYREKQEANAKATEEAKAVFEAAELEAEIAEASTITNYIADKISKVLENKTVRKYLKKPIALADAICQKSVSVVWDEMPDEVKVFVIKYPATAIPEPTILTLQMAANSGFLDMPADWQNKDYEGANMDYAEKVAKYAKNILPEIAALDKLIKFLKKTSVLMDRAFYKNIREMVQETRLEREAAPANDNGPDLKSVDEVINEVPEAFQNPPVANENNESAAA